MEVLWLVCPGSGWSRLPFADGRVNRAFSNKGVDDHYRRTVKGKGVSFMENQVDWHGKAPGKEEYEKALLELQEGKGGENAHGSNGYQRSLR